METCTDSGLFWLGFWAFVAVLVVCDCYLFSQGYDTFFQTHETPEEKEIQRLKIKKLEQRKSK